MMKVDNIDRATVEGFGDEWAKFDQSLLEYKELTALFNNYFSIFPWHTLSKDAIGFDMGCGSGRWAKLAAPRVGQLHCIDASPKALAVAKSNLSDLDNCHFSVGTFDDLPLEDNSMDFGYSLGVLHHIPDTAAGIQACVRKLKKGAPFLVYIYYAFDNKPFWYRLVWRISDLIRCYVARLPFSIRYLVTQIMAATVYFPLAKLALLLEKWGLDVSTVPLSAYRYSSFYTMRTDALDRFGTRLEKRFTAAQIQEMMEAAGLQDIYFNKNNQFWCAVGCKL